MLQPLCHQIVLEDLHPYTAIALKMCIPVDSGFSNAFMPNFSQAGTSTGKIF
jgi:hypothetical protein